jgi:hypothetical protein
MRSEVRNWFVYTKAKVSFCCTNRKTFFTAKVTISSAITVTEKLWKS